MGLDMYLHGEKFLWTDWKNEANNRMEDGYKIDTVTLELGYWRKHPNLHGYIVRTFADDVDECQRIDLDATQLRQIVEAMKADALPHTEGFFFGSSDWHKDKLEENVSILEKAITWLETKEANVSRSVYYRASW